MEEIKVQLPFEEEDFPQDLQEYQIRFNRFIHPRMQKLALLFIDNFLIERKHGGFGKEVTENIIKSSLSKEIKIGDNKLTWANINAEQNKQAANFLDGFYLKSTRRKKLKLSFKLHSKICWELTKIRKKD
ncbi:MAG: hypothetical protein ABIH42_01300 [Planctomycetota bacterium]